MKEFLNFMKGLGLIFHELINYRYFTIYMGFFILIIALFIYIGDIKLIFLLTIGYLAMTMLYAIQKDMNIVIPINAVLTIGSIVMLSTAIYQSDVIKIKKMPLYFTLKDKVQKDDTYHYKDNDHIFTLDIKGLNRGKYQVIEQHHIYSLLGKETYITYSGVITSKDYNKTSKYGFKCNSKLGENDFYIKDSIQIQITKEMLGC